LKRQIEVATTRRNHSVTTTTECVDSARNQTMVNGSVTTSTTSIHAALTVARQDIQTIMSTEAKPTTIVSKESESISEMTMMAQYKPS
jgi:hypothetical protein